MSLRRKTITIITLATATTLALGSWALFIRQTPEEAQEAYMTECIAHLQAKTTRDENLLYWQERYEKSCGLAYFKYKNDMCSGNRKFDTCEDQGM